MKAKVTNKMLKEECAVCIGYCQAWYLLYYENPKYYTCGVYGWNSDVYDIEGTLISTGYRPAGTMRIDSDLLDTYNNMAQDIVSDREIGEYYKRERVRSLLNEVLSKAVEK